MTTSNTATNTGHMTKQVWEFNSRYPVEGIYEVQATLHRSSATAFLWETQAHIRHYAATEAGDFLATTDGEYYVFTTPEEAARACIFHLHERIGKAQTAIEELERRWLPEAPKEPVDQEELREYDAVFIMTWNGPIYGKDRADAKEKLEAFSATDAWTSEGWEPDPYTFDKTLGDCTSHDEDEEEGE